MLIVALMDKSVLEEKCLIVMKMLDFDMFLIGHKFTPPKAWWLYWFCFGRRVSTPCSPSCLCWHCFRLSSRGFWNIAGVPLKCVLSVHRGTVGVMFLGADDVWPVLCEVLWSLSLREGLSTIQQQFGSNWNSLIWQTVIWLWRVALHLMLEGDFELWKFIRLKCMHLAFVLDFPVYFSFDLWIHK